MSKAIRAIRSRIIANAGLATLLASGSGHKVRAGDGSEVDEPPYVLMWRIIDRPVYELGRKTGINVATIQIDCYADTKTAAYELADQVAGALDAMRGVIDGDVWVSQLVQEDSRDRSDRSAEGADRPLAVVQTDYRLFYK
jgi:hypothetical protein